MFIQSFANSPSLILNYTSAQNGKGISVCRIRMEVEEVSASLLKKGRKRIGEAVLLAGDFFGFAGIECAVKIVAYEACFLREGERICNGHAGETAGFDSYLFVFYILKNTIESHRAAEFVAVNTAKDGEIFTALLPLYCMNSDAFSLVCFHGGGPILLLSLLY
jgi:hypothetical protein